VATIYAMVERMDAGIGRILETLDATGLRDDTLVVFSSDNGPYLGGDCMRPNGLWSGGKYDALEGGIRVPAIARWPNGLPAGTACDEMVHFVDWLPTLLGAAGVDVPRTLKLDGRDMSAALRGEPHAVPTVRFWQWNRYEPVRYCNAAMRDGPWKLYWPPIPEARAKVRGDNAPYRRGLTHPHWLVDVDGTLPQRTLSKPRPPRLFDLATDPQERADRSKQHIDRVARMTRAWDDWFDEVMAEWRRAHAENIRPHPQGEGRKP
jgi:arylsulfatase A-like enzyme